MKEPTTPFSQAMMARTNAINREFLLSQDWVLTQESPLYECFEHKNNKLLKCTIGMYGEFSIYELHWCNESQEKIFYTVNKDLTHKDYFTIVKLLNLPTLRRE